jgi:hypothetical protein
MLGDEVIAGGSRRRGPVRSRSRSPRPASTSCRCPRAASSRTRGRRRSARPRIRTPDDRATSACRRSTATRAARSAATCRSPRGIRDAVRAAGLTTPVDRRRRHRQLRSSRGALAAGDCDAVASARQSLADPDWFAKLERGDGAAVRRCEFTNYCEALDQQHQPVTCKLWDRDRPRRSRRRATADGKRRLVAPKWR